MDIPIEERDKSEVMGAWGLTRHGTREYVNVGNSSSSACNPAFDVTGPDLITGIITPVGIFRQGLGAHVD
jgi:methylthioribose-1-phosphate isomerase